MRFGCFSGILLMILAFGVMGFFMLPLIFEGNETVMNWQGAVLCGSNETFTTDFRTQSDLRGTVRGGQVYCVDAEGVRTNVTGKSIIYAMVGFAVPFLIGLFASMRAGTRASQDVVGQLLNSQLQSGRTTSGTVQVNRSTYQIDPDKVDVGGLLRKFGVDVDNLDFEQIDGGGSKTLTEQLEDLQAAYDKRLITQDEYDRLRQEIIDNISRSS